MNPKFQKIYDEILTSFFYVGKIKFAPGTVASLIPLTVLFIPQPTRMYVIAALVVGLFVLSLSPIKRMEKQYGNDPSQVVIDEIIGMLIVLFSPYIVYGYGWAFLAFGFFRLFDIFKPYPINKVNNKTGSAYVILDDVLAAVYAWVTMHCIYQLSNIFGIYYLIIQLSK